MEPQFSCSIAINVENNYPVGRDLRLSKRARQCVKNDTVWFESVDGPSPVSLEVNLAK